MSGEEDELQRAVRDACLSEHPSFGKLPPRVAIYRQLVRNTLTGVVHAILAATRREMGAAFDQAFERFLAERGPRTHYLRDVPHELVEWATPIWNEAGVQGWLLELARHEMTYFGVSTAPHLPEPPPGEIALDRPLLLSSLARIERYEHAVHESLPPSKRQVALLYYRDAEHAICTLELTPLGAALLDQAGAPLRDAVARACEATSTPMNDETLATIARLLADLGARGVLLGAV